MREPDVARSPGRFRGAAVSALAALFAVAGPASVASACSVCWGDSKSPVVKAMNSGVYVLLGVTAVVLGWFGTLILTIRRRTKRWQARKSALGVVGSRQER